MKKRVLVDVTITCDVPGLYRFCRTPEQMERAAEGWVREFQAFVRDHRSQDPVDLSVNRIYEDWCSHCERLWEVDHEGLPQCCTEAQEEWEAAQVDA